MGYISNMSVLRCVCFTLNNYTDEDLAHYANEIREISSYLVIGFEIGEKGTPHFQGYLELKKPTRFSTLKKLMGRAHIERRYGSAKQASDYCKEDGDFVEFGEMREQGKRNDLDNVRETALDGGMRAVTEGKFNLQHIKIAEKFLSYCEEGRDWKPEVIWIWGPTGTGKSRRAREIVGDDVYCKNEGNKWWDGYDGHEDVIIDDFRDSWWPITYMLALLDRYTFRVEYKGGMRQFRAKRIVITSAFPPENCYAGTGEAINQLLRRLDTVQELVAQVPVAEVEG